MSMPKKFSRLKIKVEPDSEFNNVYEELKSWDKRSNPFQFRRCDNRNIILVGRSRTGKTTIANVVEDSLYVTSEPSLYSETRKPVFHQISTYDANDECFYFFNFVDIPGLYDQAARASEQLSTDAILSFINDCLKMEITNIHMFAFVFNLHGGINEKDIDTMLLFKKKYPQLSANMALVITHCEHMKEEESQQLVNEFFRYTKVANAKLRDYFTLGTLYMGSLRYESKRDANEQSLLIEYNNVSEMRIKFIDKCIEMTHDKAFNVHKHEKSCVIS